MTVSVTAHRDGREISQNGRLWLVGFCAIGVLVSGCSKSYHVTRISDASLPKSSPDHIQVYSAADTVNKPFEVLGKVFSRRKGGIFISKSEASIAADLKMSASELGADAVIGFHHSRQDEGTTKGGNSRWGSGLAVKFSDGNTLPPLERHNFIVAIRSPRSVTYDEWKRELESAPPRPRAKKRLDAKEDTTTVPRGEVSITRDDFVKDSINIEKNWAGLISAAQFQLEKRGYYATFADDRAATVSLEQLVALEDSVADNLFGAMTGDILYVNMAKTGGYNAGLAAGASSQVSARLYSRAERKVVWEGSASASLFPTLGLFNVLAESGSSRQNRAVCIAVAEAFKTLAEAETKSKSKSK